MFWNNFNMKILFVCRGNVGRSQMAEALMMKLGGDAYQVMSAGTKLSGPEMSLGELGSGLDNVFEVMREVDIDVSKKVRKQVTEAMTENADKIILVVGIAAVPLVYRVIRAATLSVATRDFVMAARVQGASNSRIIFRELLPNIAATVLSFLLIGIAGVIALEGSLAFLGISVRPPTPSWGNMIYEGQTSLPQSEYLVGFAGLAICLFLLSLNFMGDRLRSYFDVTEIKL